MNMKSLHLIALIFGMVGMQLTAIGQEEFELKGNLSNNIQSESGQVLSVAITVGDGGSGAYKAVMCGDPGIPTHTIYRPLDLNAFGAKTKLPIVLWGNGGCRNSSGEFRNFLSEIASHGFLVLAIGPIGNTLLGGSELPGGGSDSGMLLKAIDWAVDENNNPESKFYQKIETNKIAVMGQSCGGLQALIVSSDPRITTSVIWNSGLFKITPEIQAQLDKMAEAAAKENKDATTKTPSMSLPSMAKSDLQNLHAPIAYFTGGEFDIASVNAEDDFDLITQIPVMLATYDFSEKVSDTGNKFYGHYPATYREANGGDFAVAGVAWLKWKLKEDHEAGKMFIGGIPGLTANKHWTIRKKNID